MTSEGKKCGKSRLKQTASNYPALLQDKIIEQNVLLLNILNSIPYAIHIIDANDFSILLTNRTVKKGVRSKNNKCYAFIYNQSNVCSNDNFVCPLEQVKTCKKPVITEFHANDKAGNAINVEINAFPVFDNKGNVIQIIECLKEIPNLKIIEEVTKREDKFSAAFNFNPGASIIISVRDRRFLDVNEAFCSITGYSREEVIGHTALELGIWSKEDASKVIKALIEQGKIRNLSGEFYLKTGEKHTALFSAEIFKAGNEQCAIIFANDITEGKQIAEKLKKSENQYRELIDSLPQIIFEVDTKGYITFVSRNAIQTMGYSKEDIKSGLNAFNFFISEDRATLQKNLERRLQGEITGGTKYTAVRKNGSTFPVIVYSVPMVTENRIIGLRGIAVELPNMPAENQPDDQETP
jgi:PAS domain S-box-containing protein